MYPDRVTNLPFIFHKCFTLLLQPNYLSTFYIYVLYFFYGGLVLSLMKRERKSKKALNFGFWFVKNTDRVCLWRMARSVTCRPCSILCDYLSLFDLPDIIKTHAREISFHWSWLGTCYWLHWHSWIWVLMEDLVRLQNGDSVAFSARFVVISSCLSRQVPQERYWPFFSLFSAGKTKIIRL